MVLGVYLTSNINEYQRYLLGVKMASADFLELQGAPKYWSLKGLYRDCVTLPYHIVILSVMFHVSNGNIPFCFCSTFLAGMMS